MKASHIGRTGTLAVVMVMGWSIAAAAQMSPAEVEKQLEYSRCIRANGYAEFPDPGPDGRIQIRLDPKSGPRFEAAQRACKDKLPGGLAAAEQPMTPQRMQALLGFAACVRGKGVKGFPDPSPNGVFELGSTGEDISSPQADQAMKACTASNPPGGLMIRKAPPK